MFIVRGGQLIRIYDTIKGVSLISKWKNVNYPRLKMMILDPEKISKKLVKKCKKV